MEMWMELIKKKNLAADFEILNVQTGREDDENSEINPTRRNNCVYTSQWLYSTCFG